LAKTLNGRRMSMPPKSNRGGAYIMVLAASMIMFLLVVLALSITTLSRRITAQHSHYVGVYDLGASGNQQALFLLRQAANCEELNTRVLNQMLGANEPLTGESFKENLHAEVIATLGSNFTRIHAGEYRLSWDFNTTIGFEDVMIYDSFGAITILRPSNNDFFVETRIHKYIEGTRSHYATMQASIIWDVVGYREIQLDGHNIYEENMIIFLDEFTLTMIESLRITA